MSEATLAHLPVADGPEANDAKQGSSPRFVHTSGVQAMLQKIVPLRIMFLHLAATAGKCRAVLCASLHLERSWKTK